MQYVPTEYTHLVKGGSLVKSNTQMVSTVGQILIEKYTCVCSSGGSASPTAPCGV